MKTGSIMLLHSLGYFFIKKIPFVERSHRVNFTDMLSLNRFNRTPFYLQKKETFGRGEFFDVNSCDDKLISLYYYNDFIVEVHFDPFINEIDCFFAISLFDAADRYIDLSEIFVEA